MASDHDTQHVLVMIERMAREGCSQDEIVRAVRASHGQSRPEPRPLHKTVQLGRWRVDVARV
jgi:hypothetical protein